MWWLQLWYWTGVDLQGGGCRWSAYSSSWTSWHVFIVHLYSWKPPAQSLSPPHAAKQRWPVEAWTPLDLYSCRYSWYVVQQYQVLPLYCVLVPSIIENSPLTWCSSACCRCSWSRTWVVRLCSHTTWTILQLLRSRPQWSEHLRNNMTYTCHVCPFLSASNT